ncbi:MAG: cytochrome C oxidase subunit IV family protein [Anaerolineae bacterium]|nr:cytochrome C oxidase subunit IV family protein [Anaerolineae bacterium]
MTEPHHHIIPVRMYLTVFAWLMVLLAVTVTVSFFNFGVFNVFVALSIATLKAGLIMAYFMHLRYSSKLIWVFAGLGFFGLAIMILIAMGDYVARGGVIVPMLPGS